VRYQISAVVECDGGPKEALAKMLDLRVESQQFAVQAVAGEWVIDAEGPAVGDFFDVTDSLLPPS
jgi:hypothetical protein